MKKEKRKGRITKALDNSPINYFSDLFVVTMVILWIIETVYMTVIATVATFLYSDLSMWSEVSNLVSIPLTAGGAIWMIKNAVQHAIANNRGERANMDFPAVNADGETDGREKPFGDNESEEVLG